METIIAAVCSVIPGSDTCIVGRHTVRAHHTGLALIDIDRNQEIVVQAVVLDLGFGEQFATCIGASHFDATTGAQIHRLIVCFELNTEIQHRFTSLLAYTF